MWGLEQPCYASMIHFIGHFRESSEGLVSRRSLLDGGLRVLFGYFRVVPVYVKTLNPKP